MKWDEMTEDFLRYLKLEKSLAKSSIDAYTRDVLRLREFVSEIENKNTAPDKISTEEIKRFLQWLNELGMSSRSQARMVSGIKMFYKFLLIEDYIAENPASLIETPRIERKLPEVISIEEIDEMISTIDLSTNLGHRNKAIIETLYGCGLRVSELCNLLLSNVYFDKQFIRLVGKGNKERLVPVNLSAIESIKHYTEGQRRLTNIKKEAEDNLFLTTRGRAISRIMIFNIIKKNEKNR